MVTTRPMIRLSGFNKKTSIDEVFSSSGCSSFSCPKRGNCDCEANTLFRQHLLHQQLLQRQHHKTKTVLKQHQPQPQQPQIPSLKQPPPIFRPTISDSNSESDREVLRHFHRNLQQLHRLTCPSVENATYFGTGLGTKVAKTKHPNKSLSFRDIRSNHVAPLQKQPLQSSTLALVSCSSSSSSPLSVKPSKEIKRRHTTRSAKDWSIGVSRVKLLAKYWNKGKSSGGTAEVDSGNGGSGTSRSSSDSQSSNYSGSGVNASKSYGTTTPSNANRVIISPRSGRKRYENNSGNRVTYKVRYDIPSSWDRGSTNSPKNKGCSSASSGCSVSSSDDVDARKSVKFCNQCGRNGANLPPPVSPLSPKTRLLKTLTFVRQTKPQKYTPVNKENRHGISGGNGDKCDKQNDNLVSSSPPGKNMVQHRLPGLGRSKSQKCPERSVLIPPTKSSNIPKLAHNDEDSRKCIKPRTVIPIPNRNSSGIPLCTNVTQPKVRFKEHHRSELCLNESRNTEKISLLRKWTRRSSSSSTVTKMLPNEKEFYSMYDNCRIPRPKVKGIVPIVPTHSYGITNYQLISNCSSPASPVSRSSAIVDHRVRRRQAGEFTEISLQDDEEDSETSGFESEQNNVATTGFKDEHPEVDVVSRKQQAQRNIPAEMTPAGKYFTDFKTLYHYQQEQRLSIQKSPTPSRVLSFRKPHLPALLSRSGKKKGFEESTSAEFLKSLPIFRKLNDGFFAKLVDHISEVSFGNGNYIFRQGEKGDSMYFLVTGSAKATFKSLESGKSDEIFLKTLHPGDYFGERAFLTRSGQYAHNALASSEDGVTCVKIDREAYEELIYKCHDFKIRVLERPLKKMKIADDIAKIKLDDLRIVTTLGVGGFGRVELCTLASDSRRAFALKKMKKCQIVATRQIEHIRSEKSILLETNCDFICKLYKTFKDPKYLYMLMECCLGGELWTVLRDRGRFEDATAKFYIGCVVEALKYLHTRNIIYRDLKPENLLLDSSGYVKLVDFGFAKKLDGRKTWTFCGTPEYCAPEIILNKGHDLSADFWSLGVLMYELLTGTPPFTGGDPLRTYKIILQGIDAIEFPPTVGKYAFNLIRKLCRDNPADRLGAQRGRISDIKKHKWFDGLDWYSLQTRTLTPPIIPDVRGPLDFGNFDEYPPDRSGSPPDDLSGWDWDF